ncbi:MAG: hypothetical protein M3N53_14150 [Actinomycetota bacterium]|nr:hypothetical protein [Actinomycetota bacterium]
MELTVWNVMRSMAGIETGRDCRRCQEPLSRRDGFAMSEGVCSPCRVAGN